MKNLSMQRNRLLLFLFSLIIAVVVWQAIVMVFKLPAFILPSPGQVWLRFIKALRTGQLLPHFSYTLLEVVLGLVSGSLFAAILGYLFAKSPAAEKVASPFLVASQSIPVVAIAPLLVIWFGPGLFSKVLICALTVFFPILTNTVVGLREVPQDLHALMRSLYATRWQNLRYLEIPSALPIFLGGVRVGAALSVIGAIVGELVGSDRGLGFLINVGRGQYDTALVFVAVITLILLASSLYWLVLLIEKRTLAWQSWRKKEQ